MSSTEKGDLKEANELFLPRSRGGRKDGFALFESIMLKRIIPPISANLVLNQAPKYLLWLLSVKSNYQFRSLFVFLQEPNNRETLQLPFFTDDLDQKIFRTFNNFLPFKYHFTNSLKKTLNDHDDAALKIDATTYLNHRLSLLLPHRSSPTIATGCTKTFDSVPALRKAVILGYNPITPWMSVVYRWLYDFNSRELVLLRWFIIWHPTYPSKLLMISPMKLDYIFNYPFL
ncbi:hypothetical protein KY289_018343 [Solanum tuberosum]|nr:hypothetical protein KY289_018343 [Solanum tuberosum]